MKRATLAIAAVLLATGVALAWRAFRGGDPEITNAEDLAPPVTYPDTPDFFASDPALAKAGGTEIKLQYLDQDNKQGLKNAAYFIQLADGRFAFGYTTENGYTRPIYNPVEQPYKVFWVEDALEKWFEIRRRSRGSDGGRR